MSITTALKARRESLTDREAGFTLIELLVVVIIIGILAAIAIPIYLGVQNNAKDASVKSDLTNNKTAIVSAATDNNGALPSAITAAGVATIPATSNSAATSLSLVPNGWSNGGNTSDIKYVVNSAGTAWCLLGTSTTGKQFTVFAGTTGVTALPATPVATTCTPA